MLVFLPLQAFAKSGVQTVELVGEALHSKLVKEAIQYDVFNQRCRGVSARKNQAKVNRLFIRKYSLSFNNYIKAYLSQDPRQATERIRQAMLTKLLEVGGCQSAARSQLHKEFKRDFRRLYQKSENSLWFPKVIFTR